MVTVQRSLVDFQLKHIFPERLSKLQSQRLWRGVDELDRYMLVELDDAQECSGIVDELLGDKLKRYTRVFQLLVMIFESFILTTCISSNLSKVFKKLFSVRAL